MKISKKIFLLWALLLLPFMLITAYFFYEQKKLIDNKKFNRKNSIVGSHFSFDYLKNNKGEKIEKNILQTDFTIIDFWFEECPTCITEMNQFEDIIKGKEDKLSILSVSIDSENDWQKLLKANNKRVAFLYKNVKGWSHALLQPPIDSFPEAGSYIIHNYKTNVYPLYFVLDRNGKIIASPKSAVDYIKVNFENKISYFLFIQKQIKELGFFYIFTIVLIFYSGIFWLLTLLILSLINLFGKRSTHNNI
ncbi:MAG: TlpA family protein disulfide reductase [Ferruginibacter sp.]